MFGLPGTAWTETDTLIATAWEIHERSRCTGGCGHYVDEAWDDEADGWYEADDSTVCAACAARERHINDQKGTPEPGVMLRVVAKDGWPPTGG